MLGIARDSFSRPADTTQYAANDLVANDVDAADVAPMSFSVAKLGRGCGTVKRAILFTDNQAVTAAIFNLHLFSREPDVNNGDNGAFSPLTAQYYLGAIPLDLSTGAAVSATDKAKPGAPTAEINFDLTEIKATERRLWGLLATGTGGTYTPASGEVFEVTLEFEAVD